MQVVTIPWKLKEALELSKSLVNVSTECGRGNFHEGVDGRFHSFPPTSIYLRKLWTGFIVINVTDILCSSGKHRKPLGVYVELKRDSTSLLNFRFFYSFREIGRPCNDFNLFPPDFPYHHRFRSISSQTVQEATKRTLYILSENSDQLTILKQLNDWLCLMSYCSPGFSLESHKRKRFLCSTKKSLKPAWVTFCWKAVWVTFSLKAV